MTTIPPTAPHPRPPPAIPALTFGSDSPLRESGLDRGLLQPSPGAYRKLEGERAGLKAEVARLGRRLREQEAGARQSR